MGIKSFYAIILTVTSTILFFWTYVFIVPAPRLYLSDTINTELSGDSTNTIVKRIAEISKIDEKKRFYYFDPAINQKRARPLIMYLLLTATTLVVCALTLRNRAYIAFPLILSSIIAGAACSMLWIWVNTIYKNIYLDIQRIRDIYYNVNSLQFLGLFIFIEGLIISFGYWYNFPEKIAGNSTEQSLQQQAIARPY